jgi:hypothetical protein
VRGPLGLGHRDDRQVLRPVRAGRSRDPPGVAVRLHPAKRRLHFLGELGALEYEVPAHLGDLVDGRDDEHRARPGAVAARRTGPDRVFRDPAADQLLPFRGGAAVAAARSRGQDLGRRLVDCVAHVADEHFRVERLRRERRRTDDPATAALGARVSVEHALPGEVLDLRDAEVLSGLEVWGPEATHRLELHEEDVRDGRDDVEVLRVGQVIAEEEDVQEVGPPRRLVQPLERCGGQASERPGDRSDRG